MKPHLDYNIVAKPFDKQKEFFQMVGSRKYDFGLYGGAVRGGKTVAILVLFLMLCKLYPKSRWIIVRRDTERIKTTVLPTFFQLMPHGQTTKKPSQGNGWEWHHCNGSVIKFFGENKDKDPELLRFRGLECDGIGLEEMDVSKTTFYKCFERIGTWRMNDRKAAKDKGIKIPPCMVLGTSNPQEGWVKELIYDPWKKGELNPKWFYLESKVYDNPFVDESYIQRQRDNLLESDFNKFIEGDWEITKNDTPWFDRFKKTRNVRPELIVDTTIPLELGIDFNYGRMACVVGQFKRGFGINIFDCIDAQDVEDLAHKILQKYSGHKAGFKIFYDQSAKNRSANTGNFNSVSKLLGLLNLSSSSTQTKHNRKKNMLHKDSRTLIQWIFEKIPLYFDDRYCSELIKEVLRAEVKVNADTGKENLRKDDSLYSMDRVDGLRYLLENMIPYVGIEKKSNPYSKKNHYTVLAEHKFIKAQNPELLEEYLNAA